VCMPIYIDQALLIRPLEIEVLAHENSINQMAFS